MKAFGLARIGRDAEIRHTAGGDAVASLSLAFTYGRKGEDGKRPTQWVDASIWGKRAEALAQYLTKGSLVAVTLEDVAVQTFNKSDGSVGTKLAGRVIDIELAGGNQPAAAPVATPPPTRPTPRPTAPPAGSGFDDMDDDIPFASSCMSHDMLTSKAKRMARYDY